MRGLRLAGGIAIAPVLVATASPALRKCR